MMNERTIKRLLMFGGGMVGGLVAAIVLASFTPGVAQAHKPASASARAIVHDDEGPDRGEQEPVYTQWVTAPQDVDEQLEQPVSSTGSITAPEQSEGQNDEEGNTPLNLAKITADQAKQAALAQFPGATVAEVELDNEDGVVVYKVKLTNANGNDADVTVDAGNGTVLASHVETPEQPDQSENNGDTEHSDGQDSGGD